MTGTIKKLVLEKGFGFIKGQSAEYFFHRSTVRGAIFETLTEGQRVDFDEEPGDRGPRATNVRVA